MPIDDARRPEPAPPQPGPVASDAGLTGSEFGRPPSPGEVAPDQGEQERAEDVDDPARTQPQVPRGSSNQTTLPSD